jgi:NAD(P)H dehydrogenase (quinone)
MPKIAIIYHSRSGHTKVVAQHIAHGAEQAGGTVALLTSAEAMLHLDALDSMDALVFGCPTFMGSTSAEFKAFMDATGNKWRGLKWRNKIAAGFANSSGWSGDKLCTLTQLAIFAAQHGMLWVGLDIKAGFCHSNGSINDLNRIGSWLGLMTQSNDDESPAASPPQSDRLTAEHFGSRIYEVTKQFLHGRTNE